jgi:deoxyribodipyrimidine photo-lyase
MTQEHFSMNGPQNPPETPAELAVLAADPRSQVRRGGAPRPGGNCVVYWMQRAIRIFDNPALDVAIEAGNTLGLPVVIYFSVIPNYPHANLRHNHFLGQALRDAAADAAEPGVGFVIRRAPDHSLEAFLEEVQAAMLIGDENPCREPERWRRVLARRLRLPYWTVDADVVVPSRVFARDYFLLHHFRPHLRGEVERFLAEPRNERPHREWRPVSAIASWNLNADLTQGFTKLDRSVRPVDTFTGGSHAALRRMREFMSNGLSAYQTARNRPEIAGTSRLSPYFHFGNISPVRVALEARKAVAEGRVPAPAAERYLEELIGWRELSVLFVRHNPDYDNWLCAEPWARRTLEQHARDPRPWRYTLEQLEHARTHDELWNAAQREMLTTGWMHNVLRMYWGKKILEWAPNPATAFDWAVILNDKYQLDGRDPGGYAGIAWAIVGKHDRPWFDRPVIGTIRPMSESGMRKKFNVPLYAAQRERIE